MMPAGMQYKTLELDWSSVEVSAGKGLRLGGGAHMRNRQQRFDLYGPTLIRTDSNTFTDEYRITNPQELDGLMVITWSAQHGLVEMLPGEVPHRPERVRVTWQANLYPGEETVRKIRATVRDFDNQVVTIEKSVTLRNTLNPDLPPLCDKQPLRFECQADM